MLESKLYSLPTQPPGGGYKTQSGSWHLGMGVSFGSHVLHASVFLFSVSRALALGGQEGQKGRRPCVGCCSVPVLGVGCSCLCVYLCLTGCWLFLGDSHSHVGSLIGHTGWISCSPTPPHSNIFIFLLLGLFIRQAAFLGKVPAQWLKPRNLWQCSLDPRKTQVSSLCQMASPVAHDLILSSTMSFQYTRYNQKLW